MYKALKVEKKWREFWEKTKLYQVKDRAKSKKNFYHLVMFPYPSGDLHIGHWYNFAPADVYARLKRMQGFNVLSPIGFDAFGLPAENAAIKNKIHPKIWTYRNIAVMRRQIKSIGAIYDFSKEVITAEPEYYKWTQWMFIQMYKAGLAYKKKALANWCPKDQAVLANEQVIDGRCWRHPETLVIQKEIEQWMFKITDYAEDLINDLEKLDWPERTKLMQRNWIGKSKGSVVIFKTIEPKIEIPVYTTRIDTLFSAAYLVLSPEHPLVEQITGKDQKDKVRHYITNAHLKTELERTSLEKEKTGVFIGAYAVNPANNEKIPIWIADFVLVNYGTGAVFANAHDERDFEFAKKFNIPLKISIRPSDNKLWEKVKKLEKCYSGEGVLVNSGKFNDLTSIEARLKITEWLSAQGLAHKKTNYKLRDWVISRQRYWGAPIPIIYCQKCGPVPVPEDKLPVKLPLLKNFKPVTGSKSPLARVKSFINVKCPHCHSKAARETDTLDTFVDSSWYFLRYVDSKNNKQFAAKEKLKQWLPVNMYIGGAEHTVLHLLYSRFFVKALKNMGYLEFSEPFAVLRHQGFILGEDGQKMSKSRGNVVDPDELVNKYGADTVRMHLCFMSEYSQGGPWNSKGIIGIKRFLDRIYNKFFSLREIPRSGTILNSEEKIQRLLHQTIKKVGEDVENFHFNTAVSALMILFNAIEKTAISRETAEVFLKLLSLFAPHFTEELWQQLTNNKQQTTNNKRKFKSIHLESWPEYDAKLIEEREYELIIQINGKMRDKIRISKNLERSEVEKLVLKREVVMKHIGGAQIKKIVFVSNRLINIVI